MINDTFVNKKTFPEFCELCQAAIEERLTESQLLRLEELVLCDTELRLFYIEHVQQHLALQEWGTDHANISSL